MRDYLSNRANIGTDLLKKITVYTVLMKRSVPEESFFPYLMGTHWFKETVDLYFDGEYDSKYKEMMSGLFQRGVIKRKNGRLYTTVKP